MSGSSDPGEPEGKRVTSKAGTLHGSRLNPNRVDPLLAAPLQQPAAALHQPAEAAQQQAAVAPVEPAEAAANQAAVAVPEQDAHLQPAVEHPPAAAPQQQQPATAASAAQQDPAVRLEEAKRQVKSILRLQRQIQAQPGTPLSLDRGQLYRLVNTAHTAGLQALTLNKEELVNASSQEFWSTICQQALARVQKLQNKLEASLADF